MKIGDILAELDRNRGYFPRKAVEAASQRREEITPHLLQAIREVTDHAQEATEDESRFLHVYAMFLLARFREHRAYPLIIAMCKLPLDVLDGLIGDTITEGLCRVLASVCDGNPAPIESIVEDASLDGFVRGAALRSLSVLAHQGILARSDVIEYFGELFRGKLEKEYSHVWDALASEAVDLYAESLADDIHQAYEERLLCPGYMRPEEVEKVFTLQEETVLARSKERCPGLIDDVGAEMHWWACFEPERMRRAKTTGRFRVPAGRHDDPHTLVRDKPKIGRNEPCPCGSDKKYKKCCGAG
jgi:hypothetical protein